MFSLSQIWPHLPRIKQFTSTDCPRIFAVVACFRVAASARAVSSVTVSSTAGWLHTVLLYDATAEFIFFHPIDVIYIPEWVYLWPSFHTVNNLVLMNRAIFQIRREPILHYTRFQVVLKHNSSVSAYKEYLLYRWSQTTFCTVWFSADTTTAFLSSSSRFDK